MKTILFTDEMLKATLELRKTNTRRVIIPQPFGNLKKVPNKTSGILQWIDNKGISFYPKYKIGDIVGIKENFEILFFQEEQTWIDFFYLFDGVSRNEFELSEEELEKVLNWKNRTGKKSKLFMFDSMIRYKIKITNVRVERIQDITMNDIEKEGVITYNCNTDEALKLWIKLWDSINKKRGYGWKKNPYVFVSVRYYVGNVLRLGDVKSSYFVL